MNENFVYALQDMFSHLLYSGRRYYVPDRFCKSYKNFDGQPIDVSEQMDANEFLNFLFDKMENVLKPTPAAEVLKENFGGSLINLIVCQECGKQK